MNTTHETIELDDWEDVIDFSNIQHFNITPSYLERATQGDFPKDAFSKGQLASKAWLHHRLYTTHAVEPNSNIAILGCWIGSMVDFLLSQYIITRVYGIDIDPVSIEMADRFNYKHVQNDWKFKGVVADVSLLDTSAMTFQIGGDLIEVSPNIVINTSCEHMGTEWFETASNEQLIVMQTNDSSQYEGHINCCYSIEDMQHKYPLSNTLYAGELITPAYTRYMQIGWK